MIEGRSLSVAFNCKEKNTLVSNTLCSQSLIDSNIPSNTYFIPRNQWTQEEEVSQGKEAIVMQNKWNRYIKKNPGNGNKLAWRESGKMVHCCTASFCVDSSSQRGKLLRKWDKNVGVEKKLKNEVVPISMETTRTCSQKVENEVKLNINNCST